MTESVKAVQVAPPVDRYGIMRKSQFGRVATPAHVFVDEHRTWFTAEEVMSEIENRSHCTLDRLPVILFRKNIITAAEFLESIYGDRYFSYETGDDV